MVLVAVAFVVGGILGAVLTAALIARGQRAMIPSPSDFEMPVRPADQWLAEHASTDLPHTPHERIERTPVALAKFLGQLRIRIDRIRHAGRK